MNEPVKLSQYTFSKDKLKIIMQFGVGLASGELYEATIEVSTFDEFYVRLEQYYTGDYYSLFNQYGNLVKVSFEGFRIDADEDSFLNVVEFSNDFKRSTMIFQDRVWIETK